MSPDKIWAASDPVKTRQLTFCSKILHQSYTHFDMEMSKSNPKIGFPINFWPKKKKNCTPICLKLPKLSSKREIFQLLILFFKTENLASYSIVLLFCKKPNQTRPKSRQKWGHGQTLLYIERCSIVPCRPLRPVVLCLGPHVREWLLMVASDGYWLVNMGLYKSLLSKRNC